MSTKKSWKSTTMQNIIPWVKVIQKNIYKLEENNLNNRQYIDANKLANVRRRILGNKRLTDIEISQIEKATKNMIPERSVEPVLIMKNLNNEKIEQIINKIREREKII